MWMVAVLLIAILVILTLVIMSVLSRVEAIEETLDAACKNVQNLKVRVPANDKLIDEVAHQLNETRAQVVTNTQDIKQLFSNQDKVTNAVWPMWCDYTKAKNKDTAEKANAEKENTK